MGHGVVGYVLVKYWIYVVGLVLLLISIRTPVVAYEVCYMAFFVVLITVLQVSGCCVCVIRSWRTYLQRLVPVSGIIHALALDALLLLDGIDGVLHRRTAARIHVPVQRGTELVA